MKFQHHWGMVFVFAIAINALAADWVDPPGYSENNPVLLNQADWLRVEEPLPDNLKQQEQKPREMKIIRALYGTRDDRLCKDVTEILRDHIRNNGGFLKLTVSNTLITDPAHGLGKRLKVEYQLEGKELVEEEREGGFIQLPKVKADYFDLERPRFLMHPRLIRRDFQLNVKPAKAYLYASSLGIYDLHINGKSIGGMNSSREELNYSNCVSVLCYDISDHLIAGANTVGVVLANGQYCGPLKSDPSKICVFGFEPHFRMQLEMQSADGSIEVITTDHRWQGTYQFPAEYAGIIDDKNVETPKEIAGWDKSGFKYDEKWSNALIDRAIDCELVKPVH